jgi:hypothetical protein
MVEVLPMFCHSEHHAEKEKVVHSNSLKKSLLKNALDRLLLLYKVFEYCTGVYVMY